MNKAIPLLLEMRDDIKAVRKNTDAIPKVLEEVKGSCRFPLPAC
jgi:hypothetical protein